MEFLFNNWQEIFFGLTTVVTGASIIAKITPSKKDDEILGKILKVINLLALNPKK